MTCSLGFLRVDGAGEERLEEAVVGDMASPRLRFISMLPQLVYRTHRRK